MVGERPTAVTVVAILGFIAGGLAILGGLLMAAGGTVMASMYGPQGAYVAGYAAIGGIAMLAFGAAELVISWGLWTGKKWGWWLTVIFSGLGVLSIISGNIVGAVISAVVLYFFFKPEVKDYFGVEVEFST